MKLTFKEIARSFFIGILIFLLIKVFQYANGKNIGNIRELLIDFGYVQLYVFLLYVSNIFYIRFLLKKYQGEMFRFANLMRGILGTIMITMTGIFVIRFFVEVIFSDISFKKFIANENEEFYFVALFLSVLASSIFYGFYYYKYSQENRVKEQKIIAGTASAKFDALKHQLDPHFLFNSLNVLTSLIDENPEAATKFTTLLSKVYRYVLEQKNKELVTVEEELNFARQYMSLINMRFEDSIVFTVTDNISDPEAKVVPLSLQLLLENAVKHNQISPSRKLYISIFEENGNLVIKNNVQPKQVVKESSGVGLKNIKQRYYLLTDRPVIIKKDEKEFYIAIPMLTQEIKDINLQQEYISDKKYARAKKKVEDIKGFYIHLFIYLLMVPVFIFLNFRSTSFPWALFPIIGWGIGVTGHAMEVFGYNPLLGKSWEERKLKEFMEKDNYKNK